MEQLMLANAEVGEGELRQLGQARAQTAKDWLVGTGKITAEPRLHRVAEDGHRRIKDQGKTTRADFRSSNRP